MKKTDKENESFLRSISGVSPIKKKDILKKPIPPTKIKNKNIKTIKIKETNLDQTKIITKHTRNDFKIEKSPINKLLKKGKIPINKKVDFHGLSLTDAESMFSNTILNCYKKNLRCILFITGKGVLKKEGYNNDDIKLYYGKIRTSFLSWVRKQEIQKYILSVEQANIENGADGAFFVYLRKCKN